MLSLDFDWQTNEFMLYCRATRLREKKAVRRVVFGLKHTGQGDANRGKWTGCSE